MSTAPQGVDPVAGTAGFQRWAPIAAVAWLIFLIEPIVKAIRLGSMRGEIGAAVLVVFAASYVFAGFAMRESVRAIESEQRRALRRRLVLALVVMCVLAALATALLGETALNCLAYLAVLGPFIFGRWGVLWVALIGVLTVVACRSWGMSHNDTLSITTGVLSAGLGVWALVLVLQRQQERVTAAAAEADQAVETERGRFARDLHDVVGHSLSVVTMKAAVARRLIDVDLDQARLELEELESLARDALTDVRRAVGGYRDVSLAGELATARQVLSAAGITATLPTAADDVDPRLRELFAWAVREGVTNVVRHSRASHCTITLQRRSLCVEDDGRGAAVTDAEGGNGLLGLRERAGDLGAVVLTERLSPGFRLTVHAGEVS